MARTIQGKLICDARLVDGKQSDGGRLYLRGETVTVDKDFEHLLDPKRRKSRPKRADARDKQAAPDVTK